MSKYISKYTTNTMFMGQHEASKGARIVEPFRVYHSPGFSYYGERVEHYDLKNLNPSLSPDFDGNRMHELHFGITNGLPSYDKDHAAHSYKIALVGTQWKFISPRMNTDATEECKKMQGGEVILDEQMQTLSFDVNTELVNFPFFLGSPYGKRVKELQGETQRHILHRMDIPALKTVPEKFTVSWIYTVNTSQIYDRQEIMGLGIPKLSNFNAFIDTMSPFKEEVKRERAFREEYERIVSYRAA